MSNTRGCLLKRRRVAYFPPRRLGTELINIQVTSVLVVCPHLTSSPDLYLEPVYPSWSTIPLSSRSLQVASFTLSLTSQSMESIIIEDVTCTLQEFWCSYAFSFAEHRKHIHHQQTFFQIILYLNKLPSVRLLILSQHQLLNHVEPNFLLASPGLTFEFWREKNLPWTTNFKIRI